MEQIIRLPSGVETRVIEEGSGPTVLLLHGNPDNADEWREVITLLAARHRCIAPDLPGYGVNGATRALPPGWSYTRAAQIAFVDELLVFLAVDRVTLVVHDIGGIMGVPWAAANTGRLRGVVYTNTVAYPDWTWFEPARTWGSTRTLDRVRTALMAWVLGTGGGRRFARRFGAVHPQLVPAQLARFVRDFALNTNAKQTTVAQFRQLVRPEYFEGYDRMLAAIAAGVPTRAVWGNDDPYVPDERAEQLRAAQLTRLANVGHWVPIVAPAEVAAAVDAVEAIATRTSQTG